MRTYQTDLHQRCYNFSLEIIRLIDNLPHKISLRIISDQLIRSACSIGANLQEEKASSSRLEFKRFFEIALRSANESYYWLKLLSDCDDVNRSKINQLLTEVSELSSMIGRGVIKLKN